MLICIGGLKGSGRKILSIGAARKLGYHHYDINKQKLYAPVFTPRGLVEAVTNPTTDAMRFALYRRVLEDFPLVSKMYPDIIIDNLFHRAEPRDAFFSEAQKYFDGLRFVWVSSDDAGAVGKLDYGKAGRISLYEQKRISVQEEFQAFDASVPIFSYTGLPADAVEPFCVFLQKEIERASSPYRVHR